MTSFLTNKIVLTSGLALLSNALLPLIFVNNQSVFLQLNYYFLAIVFSIIPDAAIIIRLERIFSKGKGLIKNLYSSLYGLYSLIFLFLLFFSIFEFFIFGTLYALIIFGRHILSLFRLTHPYSHGLIKVPVFSNLLVIARNLLVIFVLLLFLDVSVIILFGFITLLEILLIFFLFINSKDLHANYCWFSNNYFVKYIFKKTFLVNFSQFLSSSIDRLIIVGISPISLQDVFFKYKILQQYIDGAYGIFGYKIHLDILSRNLRDLTKNVFFIFIFLHFVGFFIVAYFFELGDILLSHLIFESMILMLIFKRILDSVLTSILIRFGCYSDIIFKNFIESVALGLWVVIFFDSFQNNIGMLFFGLVAVGFILTVFFASYLQLKYQVFKGFLYDDQIKPR